MFVQPMRISLMICFDTGDITLPKRVQEAMQMQVEAERKKRAAILESEGKKKAAILESEGNREAQINIAEGKKRAMVLASGTNLVLSLE